MGNAEFFFPYLCLGTVALLRLNELELLGLVKENQMLVAKEEALI